jgi:hypothetical protein
MQCVVDWSVFYRANNSRRFSAYEENARGFFKACNDICNTFAAVVCMNTSDMGRAEFSKEYFVFSPNELWFL